MGYNRRTPTPRRTMTFKVDHSFATTGEEPNPHALWLDELDAVDLEIEQNKILEHYASLNT
jgi:hypothetical protein